MDDKELLVKVKYLTQHCAFPVKRDILVEELAELLEVTNSPRLYISKWSSEKILEEFADVYLMLWQMVIYLGDDTIEDYIYNFDITANDYSNIKEMTFLQKAMHAIWTISKMRRDPNIPQNFVAFRGIIWILCNHIQDNIDNLKSTKSNDILAKIREIVEYKVERQIKRIEEEMAHMTDIARPGYILTKREMEAIKNGSNSAETSD